MLPTWHIPELHYEYRERLRPMLPGTYRLSSELLHQSHQQGMLQPRILPHLKRDELCAVSA